IERRWVLVAVVAVVASGIVLGAARFLAYPAFVHAPDHGRVVVARFSSPTDPRTIIFDRQVTGAVASTLYAQLVSGQPIPRNVPSSCPTIPLAPYYHLDLTFSHAGI